MDIHVKLKTNPTSVILVDSLLMAQNTSSETSLLLAENTSSETSLY